MPSFETLPTASTIDPVADYWPIDTNGIGVTQKINRNTLLSITGAPVGTTDTQTLSGKTLTAPTINGATLSGTLIGTYTIGGTPTFPASVATLTGTQTLTGKTLTAPVITGGSIDNSTITVDSISGHTTATIVTVGGVQLNNGTIGTANAVTTNSITAGAVVPNSLATGAGSGWTWQTFTPTFANLTVGNGSVTARYTQTGKMVWVLLIFVLGTTSAVGTDPAFTPPVPASALYSTAGVNTVVGFGNMFANTAAAQGAPYFNASNASIHLGYYSPSSTSNTVAVTTATVPGTWTLNGQFTLNIFYEAA